MWKDIISCLALGGKDCRKPWKSTWIAPSLILIDSEYRSDALSLGQEAFIDLFECSCRVLEKGVVKICWDDYIITFYGQISASLEVLMINPKLCFSLLSMTSWFCCSEGKVRSVTGNEGTEWEYRYSYSLSLSSALDGGGWLTPCPSCFAPHQSPSTPCIGGWVGPRASLNGCRKSHPHQDVIPGLSSLWSFVVKERFH